MISVRSRYVGDSSADSLHLLGHERGDVGESDRGQSERSGLLGQEHQRISESHQADRLLRRVEGSTGLGTHFEAVSHVQSGQAEQGQTLQDLRQMRGSIRPSCE